MPRRCQRDWLRLETLAGVMLGLAACADPKFRDPDASEMHGDLNDASQRSMPDGALPATDAGDAQANHLVGDGGAGDAALEERMKNMEGKYFMRFFYNARDGAAQPLIKGVSTVEITKGASGLELVEQPCHLSGTAKLPLGGPAYTDLDLSRTPSHTYQVTYNGKTFDAAPAGNTTLGYDALAPAGCMPGELHATTVGEKPWLNGSDCRCPSDLTLLPETKKNDDCRIIDDDGDREPGVTVLAWVEGFEKLAMYMVQRSRDQYLNLDFKSPQQRNVLLGNFQTVRTASLLGCKSDGPNCAIANHEICPKQYNSVELARLTEGQTFSCQGLSEADAITGVFNETAPDNCEQ